MSNFRAAAGAAGISACTGVGACARIVGDRAPAGRDFAAGFAPDASAPPDACSGAGGSSRFAGAAVVRNATAITRAAPSDGFMAATPGTAGTGTAPLSWTTVGKQSLLIGVA